jgi:hypothetical protein
MTLESLRAEVDALKKMNRRLALAVGAMALAPVAALSARVMAQDAPQAVQAPSFAVVDAQGAVRARLEVDPKGSARLTFYRADGTRGLTLSEGYQVYPVH